MKYLSRCFDPQAAWAAFFSLAAFWTAVATAAEPEVSFNRDVRPILAANCFACHGPDEDSREADLRLDTFAGATADLGGYQAVNPGHPDKSELLARIESNDETLRMPPLESEKSLTPDQKQTLRRWIAAGAKYQQHWAFLPPQRPSAPAVGNSDWPRNPIDHFVLARLRREKLKPAPEAHRYTLVRRVYLDLVGLLPTPEEADAFVQDKSPHAYEKLVDRLLASPHYGERWARQWLDLARYSDTNGYEKDRPRSIWPYRDWVIKALNDDMPFDQFTIEQLAGDMLPQATAEQRIATGFHRNTMLNEEGGIDPLEFRFYAMVDRVATTGTVWLGLTTGCAQCHSHKYDPIRHTDYYRLMALLNNADEPDFLVRDPQTKKRRQEITAEINRLEAALPDKFPPVNGPGPEAERRKQHLQQELDKWIAEQRALAADWHVLPATELKTNLPRLEVLEDGSIFSTGDITKRDLFTLTFALENLPGPITALRLEVLPDDRLPGRGPGRSYYEGRQGDFFLSEVTATAGEKPVKFAKASHSYGKISVGSGSAEAANVLDGRGSTGWSTAGREGEPHQLVLNLAQPLKPDGKLEIEMLFERHFAASLGRFRWSATAKTGEVQAHPLPVPIEEIFTKDPAKWTAAQRKQVERQFLRITPHLAEARKQIEQLRKRMPEFPSTLILHERPPDNPRPTYRHHRGEYLSPKEKVQPGLPSLFAGSTPSPVNNRLEFARWLVSEHNPLAARLAVNRAWQALFGRGLVATSGDFGTQGEMPSHPELLDWLACEFVDQGWSLKNLHRLIVTSATYRQSSTIAPELLARDPHNRLLARGPRFRVHAETVRDIMLSASGLLSRKIGGPSVFPPQPASVTALAYGNFRWRTSQGADRYRRSLYTFSKRTAPFAASLVFDGPSGESCVARRNRSNTPLQALTLLNDEMFLELSRATARLVVGQADDAKSRAVLVFRRFLTRPPSQDELSALLAYQQSQLKRLQTGELQAGEIAQHKQATAELAAWMMAARAVMNLDETITKP